MKPSKFFIILLCGYLAIGSAALFFFIQNQTVEPKPVVTIVETAEPEYPDRTPAQDTSTEDVPNIDDASVEVAPADDFVPFEDIDETEAAPEDIADDELLADTAEDTTPDPNAITGTFKLNKTDVHLRAEASISSTILATLRVGSTGDVIGAESDAYWTKVNYNGLVGYMSTQYLTIEPLQ